MGDIVELGRTSVSIVWTIAIIYILKTQLRGNTLQVMADLNSEKEQLWKTKHESLNRRCKKLAKRNEVLQKSLGTAEGGKGSARKSNTEADDAS